MAERGEGDEGDRVLGVVGTFVLDRIVGLPGQTEPSDGLGGVAYTLAAASAALPPGWRLLPLARVGEDAIGEVSAWLHDADLDASGLAEAPEANNRVELRYHDGARRTERLTGGVGRWKGQELADAAAGCDALLVNFISGHELTLPDASALRRAFPGHIYADLHSLFLGMADDGTRVPRPLPAWDEWMTCFDAGQLNGDEMDLLRGDVSVETVARRVLEVGPSLLTCTRGAHGATCWVRPHDGSVVRHEIRAYPVANPDPTGCGDVWAGVMCSRLLSGASPVDAAEVASRLAAVAAGRSGVAGLAAALRAEAAVVDGANVREEEP